MTHALKSISVAIGDLTSHPANVRSNSPETYETEAIAHLTASIGVLGIIQPLLVQKIDGKFGVLAGGRRHAALNELVADKTAKGFTNKTKIECRLVPDNCDVTTALSLAENITQAPMNAIDEFEAFARMMEVDGQSPETIAKTFGTTVAAVKGRLRYGLIHPDIRAAARAKDITLDTMKAFADHPSQAVQLEVYEALTSDDSYVQAYTVRQALKTRGVQVSDDIGAFVREDYEARGGPIAADLLEEHSVLEDTALVEAIMVEKLTAAAEEARVQMGFAWAEALVRYDYGAMADYGRVYPGPVEPDAAGQKRVDEITEELEKLQLDMEDETLETHAYNAIYDRVDALEEEARDLQEAYSAEDLARAGVIASWSNGKITLHVGLVRPEDKPEATSQAASAAGPSTDVDGQGADAIVYPASLTQDLKTERAMALEQVAEAHDALDLSWADEAKSPADQFASFRALEAGEKAKLVAYATASTTQTCFARSAQGDSLMHDFEIEVMPDIRAHWTPNAALFNRFKKAWLLKILGEELGLAQEAVTLASMSKKEIVAFCDKLFAEPFATLTEAQLRAVAAWCPPMMQTTGGVSSAVDAEESAAQTETVQAKAA